MEWHPKGEKMQDFTIGWDLSTFNSIFSLVNLIVFTILVANIVMQYVFHSTKMTILERELKKTFTERSRYKDAQLACVQRYRALHDEALGNSVLDQKETELISCLIDPTNVWEDKTEEHGTPNVIAFQSGDEAVVLILYKQGKPDSMRLIERLSDNEAAVVFSKYFKPEKPCLMFKTLNEKFKLGESLT
jgi:hypothetical protein